MSMTELTLISHHLCPYVQRAVISLIEKNVPFERVDVDPADKPEWFTAISPLGKTPVLRAGDLGDLRKRGHPRIPRGNAAFRGCTLPILCAAPNIDRGSSSPRRR